MNYNGIKMAEKEIDEPNQTSNIKKQLANKKKAIAMPDQYLPVQIKANYHVLEEVRNKINYL